MEYDVIHLSEYNPKTDMYEREEHSQFHAPKGLMVEDCADLRSR